MLKLPVPRAIASALFAASALLVLAGWSPEAGAGGAVKVQAELGQGVLVPGKTDKLYLRVSLAGLAPESERKRPPVNVAIVIDRSGSMAGRKMEQAKEAAILALERLGPRDYASIVAYNHEVELIVPASRVAGVDEMAGDIARLRASGRTALYAGTREGIRQVRKHLSERRVNRVILLSDGLANVGPSRPEDLARLGREAVGDGISVTTIGLGLGYNEDLMAKLAYNSDGNHAFVEHADDLVRIFNQEFGDVLDVVAQDIVIEIECGDGFRPRRVLGRQAEIKGNHVRLRLNQIYGRQEKYVVVELEPPHARKAGAADASVAKVRVRYRAMADGKPYAVEDSAVVRYSRSIQEAEASINKKVMAAVATQIANERHERAVALRDKGRIKEAQQLLKDNAAYLDFSAQMYAAPALKELSKKNRADAAAIAKRSEWSKTRKAMRALQHKLSVQQKY